MLPAKAKDLEGEGGWNSENEIESHLGDLRVGGRNFGPKRQRQMDYHEFENDYAGGLESSCGAELF
jgi:hypothetical protein